MVVTPDKKQTQCPYLHFGWLFLSLLSFGVGGEEDNVTDAANEVVLHHTPHQQDPQLCTLVFYYCWCHCLNLKEYICSE